MFGFLGEKLIPSISTSLSASYYFHQKNISKKRAKCLHNSIYPLHYQHLITSIKKNISKKRAKCLHNSIYPLIFAPRLRDNASEKKEVWVSG